MKKIKIVILSLTIQSCIPSFAPEERIISRVDDGTVKLTWVKLVGVMDQHFPDCILLEKGNHKDTICQSYNIADLKLKSNIITIGFYGKPQLHQSINLDDERFGYEIKIDTTYTE